jgi:hypothetical protein
MDKFICTAIVALLLGVPASASAGVHLNKSEARSVVVDVLSEGDLAEEHPEADWYESFWVERASRCQRVTFRVVDCEFSIFSAEFETSDTGERMFDYCDGTMRIRERTTRYIWSDRPGECGTATA